MKLNGYQIVNELMVNSSAGKAYLQNHPEIRKKLLLRLAKKAKPLIVQGTPISASTEQE